MKPWILLILLFSPAITAACLTGETRCAGNIQEFCWQNVWVAHKECAGCQDSAGFAVCSEQLKPECCTPIALLSPVFGCRQSAGGCPIFFKPKGASCFNFQRCISEAPQYTEVITSQRDDMRHQVLVKYPKDVIIVLSDGIETLEIPATQTGQSSYAAGITPPLKSPEYSINVFDGLRRIYAGRLSVALAVPYTFTPDYLMSNTEFTNKGSVTAYRFQTYFRQNNLWIAEYYLPSGISISQKLVNEAGSKGINPLLLMTRVQTEQSAIQKQPDEAQLNSLTGCKLSDPSMLDPDSQIECAAERLRYWYDYAKPLEDSGTLPEMRLDDGSLVSPKNAATYSLYKYTPYSYSTPEWGGNELHSRVYSRYRQALVG